MKYIIIIAIITILSGCANHKGAEAYYAAQAAAIRPTLQIVGAMNADGSQQPVRIEAGSIEVWEQRDLAQFREDDRLVRGAETIVAGAGIVAGVMEVGKTVRSSNNRPIIEPQVVQLPAPEVIQLPAPEVIFAP